MSEKTVGFNFPPLHPRCRSTVAPYIEGSGRLESRIGKVNGRRLHVPETMNYKEFKQRYLTKSAGNNKINEKMILTSSKVLSNGSSSQVAASLTKFSVHALDCKDFETLKKQFKTKYKIEVSEELKSVHFGVLRQSMQGIETVLNEFPKAQEYLKSVRCGSLSVMSTTYDGEIRLNEFLFSNPKRLKSLIIDNQKGYHPKNTGISGAGSHEGGHILELALIGQNGGNMLNWKQCTYSMRVINEAIGEIQKHSRKSIIQLKREISSYSLKSESECLSEAVSDYLTNKEKSAELSKVIWKILKRELG